MSKIKCVIFDCDGVLVDTEPLAAKMFAQMVVELGGKATAEEMLVTNSGKNLAWCMQKIETDQGLKFPDGFAPEFRKNVKQVYERELKAIAGVVDFVEALHLPFCVASNGPTEQIVNNLRITGLLSHFEENIFSAYEINKFKPDPALFLHAAATMGFKPDECLVIEDSMTGIAAAKAGGLHIAGLLNEINEVELKKSGVKTFHTYAEIATAFL